MTSIFAIIVHFGHREITDRAIRSLMNGSDKPEHCIIIDHGDVSYSPKNYGYAAGLAAGVRQAALLGATRYDLLLCMNNDALCEYDGIKRLKGWWNTYGGPKVIAGASLSGVALATGRANIAGHRLLPNIFQIPYIHGSCMVFEYGLATTLAFPEDFFMYWEDVALSLHAQKQGARLIQIPFAFMLHDDTPSPLTKEKLYYLVRNGAYVLEHEVPYAWTLWWYIINTVRRVYHRIQKSQEHQIISLALRDARVGQLGKRQL